jgi:hypothetical protein
MAVPVASREACEEFRRHVDEIVCAETPEPFYAVGSWYEDFSQTSAEKPAADLSPRPFQQAPIFAGLGDKERTLEALDRSAVLGPFRIGRALNEPEFALLRGDPRVKALRKKVGLPE